MGKRIFKTLLAVIICFIMMNGVKAEENRTSGLLMLETNEAKLISNNTLISTKTSDSPNMVYQILIITITMIVIVAIGISVYILIIKKYDDNEKKKKK